MMLSKSVVTAQRWLSVEKRDIGKIFCMSNIQKMLKDITRYEEEKVFAPKQVARLTSPKMVFMTDKQLEKAKDMAYRNVRGRIQMPPVMQADTSEPKVLARNEEIVGYSKWKVMFVDVSPGFTNRKRLMSVRETDGTLRFPTHEERSRLNHMLYPSLATVDPPKLFETSNLERLFKEKKYHYVLDRACIQFEPDDPRFVDITSKVYDCVDNKGHFDCLRSTRHFGPMALYLAFNKRADNLILDMLSRGLLDDAAKLVKIYGTCNGFNFDDCQDSLVIVRNYADNYSNKKSNIELSLQQIQLAQKSDQSPKEPGDEHHE